MMKIIRSLLFLVLLLACLHAWPDHCSLRDGCCRSSFLGWIGEGGTDGMRSRTFGGDMINRVFRIWIVLACCGVWCLSPGLSFIASAGTLSVLPANRVNASPATDASILAGLPPDPGAAGMASLEGVDSDKDGLRDDVQRWIAMTYPNSEKTRAALAQMTKSMQLFILDGSCYVFLYFRAISLEYLIFLQEHSETFFLRSAKQN